jgi:hypothetical protein
MPRKVRIVVNFGYRLFILAGLLTVLFISLKLLHAIHWSWAMAFSPILLTVAFIASLGILFLLGIAFVSILAWLFTDTQS